MKPEGRLLSSAMGGARKLRRIVGSLIHDWPRLFAVMGGVGQYGKKPYPWALYKNRHEKISLDENGGVRCDWNWTSDLDIAKLFPSSAKLLLRNALTDFPIELASEHDCGNSDPELSFIIGHRGTARLPLLLATIRSIAAQKDVAIECIVVEQSDEKIAESELPAWVRYIHTPLPRPDMPYCRSWAFNVGAKAARTQALVLHDNDMLVPERYAVEILRRFERGYEFVDLKRFVFYLDALSTQQVIENGLNVGELRFETVVQNLVSGGSVAALTSAYWSIGGFDESFMGWGGEDNEFWQRAETAETTRFGLLPILHLWHAPQPEKNDPEAAALRRFHDVARNVDRTERIKRLSEIDPGRLSGPMTVHYGVPGAEALD